MNEFELITRYFKNLGAPRSDVVLGVGDDGAILATASDAELIVVADTLVAGRHFPLDAPPASIGHRALAVNLSDVAAMGGLPCHATLALTFPQADPEWLQPFAGGFAALAQQHQVALVGGDTTAGPLTITVNVLGNLPRGTALRRSGAQPGDRVFVSGTPGDATLGLRLAQLGFEANADAILMAQARAWPEAAAQLRRRFEYPTPRVPLGLALRHVATSCIDVSDGLGGDLGKIAAASGVAIEIEPTLLPLSSELKQIAGEAVALECALTGGDDYELAFTVPATQATGLTQRFRHICAVTEIGRVRDGAGVMLRHGTTVTQFAHKGFDHFR
jgi:thiamine-monophosphate kinase